MTTLNNEGYEAYVVGGCVRDFLMGVIPKDYDITTSATPTEIKNLFNKTFDTGIEHGTVTVVLNKENYEVTTFRIDGEYENQRSPKEVFFTSNINEDLQRRDFTINAIAYNEKTNYVDPYNGILDISKKIIKGVGNPLVRFSEDALRMLRAIRFSGTTGFNIDEQTYSAIIEKRELLKKISVERIREELTKLLLSKNPNQIELLINTELIKYYDQSFYLYLKTNLHEIINMLNNISKDIVSAFSALFYKLDKDSTLIQMKNFKFDNNTIKNVTKVIDGINNCKIANSYETRKIMSLYGVENTKIIFEIWNVLKIKDIDKFFKIYYDTIKNNYPLQIKDLSINGNDLKKLGVSNGVQIGEMLNLAMEEVLKDPEKNNKEDLIKIIKKHNLL